MTRRDLCGIALAGVLAGGAVGAAPRPAEAQAGRTDLFVVYTSKSRDDRDRLVTALPDGLQVQTYNSDILAIADYSGKQKALARLDRARIIVVLGDRAAERLGTGDVQSGILLVESEHRGLNTTAWTVRIVPRDRAARGAGASVVDISDPNQIPDAGVLRAADVVTFDATRGNRYEILARVVGALLST